MVKIYNKVPAAIKRFLGKSNIAKGLVNALNKPNGVYRIVKVNIERRYQQYLVRFSFYAPLKEASKALKKGVETTLLNNTIKLCKFYKSNQHNLTVLDIGANFGFLSLVWSQSICRNQGQIVAFEPNRQVHDSFAKSIDVNNLKDAIILENLAVGIEEKVVELFLNNTTSNVLKTEIVTDSVNIPMVTVDSYVSKNNFNKCDLIKIDVDGIELDILKGSEDTLKTFQPLFVVETNNDRRILDFFKTRNYKVLDMNLEEYQLNNALPPNIFCVPN
nr:FkbM family methyltransferase [Aestuariivivens sediminicola]